MRQLALGLPGPHVGCPRYAPSHTRPCRILGPRAGRGPTGSPWGPELATFAKEIRYVCDAERIPETAALWTPRSGGAHGRLLGARIGHFCNRDPPRLRRGADPRNCRILDPPLGGVPTGGPWGPELATFAKEIRHVCDAERIPESVASQIHSFSILPHSVHHIYCTHIKLHHIACTT